MRGYSRRQILILITFALADFCCALCVSLQSPFYPAEAERKGVSATEYGLVFGVFELTVFLISPLYGKYISHIGPSFMFSSGIFVTGFTCILFGFLDKIYVKSVFLGFSFAIRIIEALGSAAFLTASFSLIAEEFPDAVGKTFASLETCYGIGLIAGPTVGGALYEIGGFILPFLSLGGTFVVISAIIVCIIPHTSQVRSHNRNGSQMAAVIKIPLVIIFIYVNIVTTVSIGFLQTTLEPHLRPFGLSPFQTGLMFMICGGFYAILAPIWGILCDKTAQPSTIVSLGLLSSALCFLLIGPAFFIPMKSTLPLCICSLILQGIGTGAEIVGTFSGMQREAMNYGLPDNIDTYGIVTGIWTSSLAFGAFLGPTIAGYLIDLIGFRRAIVIVLAIFMIGFLAIVLNRTGYCWCQRHYTTEEGNLEAKAILGVDSRRFYGARDDSFYQSSLETSPRSSRRSSSSGLVVP